MKPKASTVLMIRPVNFTFNAETAASNAFQNLPNNQLNKDIQALALNEFNAFVKLLTENKIEVIVFDDTAHPRTPDSIFPNNWISFHETKQMIIYPILAENRRQERRTDIIDFFKNKYDSLIDLSHHENSNQFLEGTGSIVFDYEHKIAYTNTSSRTNKNIIEKLCEQLNYKNIGFKAEDEVGNEIYHTNVLLCIGNGFAVLCSASIKDKVELNKVMVSLQKTNHTIIEITLQQMKHFAGNMYQLYNSEGQSFIIMSTQAHDALKKNQIQELEKFGTLLHTPLQTIEKYGGGSARCMIADICY